MPGLGLFLAATIAGSAVQSILPTMLTVVAALVALIGFLLFSAGVAVHVLHPIFRPVDPSSSARYSTILGCLYLSYLVTNVVTLIYVGRGLLLERLATGSLPLRLDSNGQTISIDTLIVSAGTQELVLFGILYLRIIRPGVLTFGDMGWSRRDLGKHFGVGIMAALTVLFSLAIVQLLLQAFGIRQTQWQTFTSLRDATLLQFGLMFLIASLMAGFVEESFFRGYAFRALYRRYGARHAFLASALIFSGAHVNLQAFVPFFVVGLVLAYFYNRSGSMIPNTVAHVVNNGVGLAVLYFGMA